MFCWKLLVLVCVRNALVHAALISAGSGLKLRPYGRWKALRTDMSGSRQPYKLCVGNDEITCKKCKLHLLKTGDYVIAVPLSEVRWNGVTVFPWNGDNQELKSHNQNVAKQGRFICKLRCVRELTVMKFQKLVEYLVFDLFSGTTVFGCNQGRSSKFDVRVTQSKNQQEYQVTAKEIAWIYDHSQEVLSEFAVQHQEN